QVQLRRAGVLGEPVLRGLDCCGDVLGDAEPVPGVLDRRLDQLGELLGAELVEGQLQPGEHARPPGGEPAVGGGAVLDYGPAGGGKHVGAGGGRGGRVEVNGEDFAVGSGNGGVSAVAADAGGWQRDDSRDQRRGDDRIDGVAAGGEHGVAG